MGCCLRVFDPVSAEQSADRFCKRLCAQYLSQKIAELI